MNELKQQLAQINLAIEKIETGAQEYNVGSRSLKRGDLSALYSERRRLKQEIASLESNGGMYAVAYLR